MRKRPTRSTITLTWLIFLTITFGMPTWIWGWRVGIMWCAACVAFMFVFGLIEKDFYKRVRQH
jgi:hypothetical protein